MIPEEAFEMVRAYNNAQERGWNPVSLGRAQWVPAIYVEAVEHVANVVAEMNAEARRRAEAAARHGRGGAP